MPNDSERSVYKRPKDKILAARDEDKLIISELFLGSSDKQVIIQAVLVHVSNSGNDDVFFNPLKVVVYFSEILGGGRLSDCRGSFVLEDGRVRSETREAENWTEFLAADMRKSELMVGVDEEVRVQVEVPEDFDRMMSDPKERFYFYPSDNKVSDSYAEIVHPVLQGLCEYYLENK